MITGINKLRKDVQDPLEMSSLLIAKHGRPVLIGEELDNRVLQHNMAIRKKGGCVFLKIIGSNCPGISGTVPDVFILSLVPEGIAETHGRRTTKQRGAKNVWDMCMPYTTLDSYTAFLEQRASNNFPDILRNFVRMRQH